MSNPASEVSAVNAKKKPEKTASARQSSVPSDSTSVQQPALTISPFALQKFPFVSVQHRYAAAIKENGEITYTGQIDVDESEGFSQWKNIKALAGDSFHTVALKSDGTVAAVGENWYGQCNIRLWKKIAAITTGHTVAGNYTLALRIDGTVVATKGIRCHNEIRKWNSIASVAVGTWHIVGLKTDGTAIAAGENWAHQCDVDNWKNIKSIACEDLRTVGLTEDGTIVATANTWGAYRSKWRDIIAISCGNSHTAGLRANGTVVAFGFDYKNQCNTSSWSDIIDISCTRNITVGLKKDGTIITTGDKNDIKGYEDLSSWRDIIAIECRVNHLIGLKADGTVCVSDYKDLSGVRIPDIYKR